MSENKVEIKNLILIFGKGKAKENALKMLDQGKTIKEIREETKCAVGVNDVSFEIKHSEFFVIVGLSGSGKSSFIRCLNLLNKPTRGQVLIDGEDIQKYNKDELREFRRKKVAMVFQNFGLLSHRSVIANVEYGLEVQGIDKVERRKKAMQTIELVGLKGWEKYYPRQLSGGMKQRVGLARALANEPDLLLMDEPFSALDPLIRREMQTELLSLEDYLDRTIIFITHDMNEAFKLGDRIALMKDGKIIQIGTPKEFFNNPADDYVKSFIDDVDKSRILRVKTVMRKPEILFNEKIDIKEAKEQLESKGLEHAYVVDDNRKLIGYVNLECLNSQKTFKECIIENTCFVKRNSFISEILSELVENDFDVPVIDSKGDFRGIISNDDVIAALA